MPTSAIDWLLYFFISLLPPAVIAYFCGCFNGAVIISKYILRDDVRRHGSGNAGLTNFWRTFGGKLTLVVILLDVVKAVVAVGVSSVMLGGTPFSKYWAGLFCLLGHMFPCMFGFKGGKGILSGGAIAMLIDWRIALVVWGGFLLLTALTRWVSLGSCFAAAAFPVMTWIIYPLHHGCLFLSFLIGGLILWQHRTNIRRLLRGEENKLRFHKNSESPF